MVILDDWGGVLPLPLSLVDLLYYLGLEESATEQFLA